MPDNFEQLKKEIEKLEAQTLRVDFWNDKNTLPNKLGSVRSVIAYVILNTINSLEEFTKIISSIVDMPYDISPDYSVFIRSPHISALIESNKYINEQPWNK